MDVACALGRASPGALKRRHRAGAALILEEAGALYGLGRNRVFDKLIDLEPTAGLTVSKTQSTALGEDPDELWEVRGARVSRRSGWRWI